MRNWIEYSSGPTAYSSFLIILSPMDLLRAWIMLMCCLTLSQPTLREEGRLSSINIHEYTIRIPHYVVRQNWKANINSNVPSSHKLKKIKLDLKTSSKCTFENLGINSNEMERNYWKLNKSLCSNLIAVSYTHLTLPTNREV